MSIIEIIKTVFPSFIQNRNKGYGLFESPKGLGVIHLFIENKNFVTILTKEDKPVFTGEVENKEKFFRLLEILNIS